MSEDLIGRLRAVAEAQARDDGHPVEIHAAWEAAEAIVTLESALALAIATIHSMARAQPMTPTGEVILAALERALLSAAPASPAGVSDEGPGKPSDQASEARSALSPEAKSSRSSSVAGSSSVGSAARTATPSQPGKED